MDENEEEEEEEEEAVGEGLKVTISVPEERAHLVNPCQLAPVRIQQSRMSFFLSGLLVMALTVLWLAFV